MACWKILHMSWSAHFDIVNAPQSPPDSKPRKLLVVRLKILKYDLKSAFRCLNYDARFSRITRIARQTVWLPWWWAADSIPHACEIIVVVVILVVIRTMMLTTFSYDHGNHYDVIRMMKTWVVVRCAALSVSTIKIWQSPKSALKISLIYIWLETKFMILLLVTWGQLEFVEIFVFVLLCIIFVFMHNQDTWGQLDVWSWWRYPPGRSPSPRSPARSPFCVCIWDIWQEGQVHWGDQQDNLTPPIKLWKPTIRRARVRATGRWTTQRRRRGQYQHLQ